MSARVSPPAAAPRDTPTRIGFSVVLATCVLASGCGGGSTAGGGSGGYEQVLDRTRVTFGTTMIAGTVENGDTLKITLQNGAGTGMAKLFLCGQIVGFLRDAGLAGSRVLIIEESGKTIATDKDC